jgi:hypothetical protein
MNTTLDYDPEIAEKLGKTRERAILFNPMFVQGENPEARAMWMRDVVCHEMAHFFAGMHDEQFTAAETNVQEASLPVIGDILKIGKLMLKAQPKTAETEEETGRLELSLKSILEGSYAVR